MYVLLVYDIEEDRVTSIMKICRQFLNHIQNSVFEGELTNSKYKELTIKLKEKAKNSVDSVIIFKFRSKDMFKKEVIGVEKAPIDNIL